MRSIMRNIWLPTAILAAMLSARSAKADEAPLFEQEPFDTIKLDDENKNVVLKVQPLDLPNRHVPAHPKPDGRAGCPPARSAAKRLQAHLGTYCRSEAIRANGARRSGAIDRQRQVRRGVSLLRIPAAPLSQDGGTGPRRMRNICWRTPEPPTSSSGTKNRSACCGSCSTVIRTTRASPTAIQRVVGKLFDRWLAEENYVAARGISARSVGPIEGSGGSPGQRRQSTAAKTGRRSARQGKSRFSSRSGMPTARRDCQLSLAAWPEIEGGAALAAAMRAKYPLVEVGVTATAADGDAWADASRHTAVDPLAFRIDAVRRRRMASTTRRCSRTPISATDGCRSQSSPASIGPAALLSPPPIYRARSWPRPIRGIRHTGRNGRNWLPESHCTASIALTRSCSNRLIAPIHG